MSESRNCQRVDISSRTHLRELLTDFYSRAFADEALGPIFIDVARMDLAAHLPVMCDFWETVLFRTGSYRRNALTVHRDLHLLSPLQPPLFVRWLQLWQRTVDDRHAGPVAEHAKQQAARIAGSMSRRLNGPDTQAAMAGHVPTERPSLPGGAPR